MHLAKQFETLEEGLQELELLGSFSQALEGWEEAGGRVARFSLNCVQGAGERPLPTFQVGRQGMRYRTASGGCTCWMGRSSADGGWTLTVSCCSTSGHYQEGDGPGSWARLLQEKGWQEASEPSW